MSSKRSEKRQNKEADHATTTPAMSGVILLLRKTFQLYRDAFGFIFGYISWLLIPIAISAVSYSVLDEATFVVVDLFFGTSLFFVLSMLVQAIFIKSTPFLLFGKAIPLPLLQKATLLAFPYFVATIILQFATYAGLILFIIPGIMVSVLFAFAPTIIVLEERALFDAFKRSRESVRGRFWMILQRHIGGQLFIFFIQAFTLGGLLLLTTPDLSNILEAPFSFHQDIVFRLVMALFLPLSPIYTALLYISLRER